MTEPTQPLVVVGAARSGTKILRDSLAVATGVPAVPYDVGYVWRHGNERALDDCQRVEDVTPQTRRLVGSFLGRYADGQGRVIEKTVGNTLRVPYVAETLPGARFVHLVRDGADVAESARREWQRPTDWRYLLGKARHFPWRLAPTYGVKFVRRSAVGGRGGPERHADTWGPRYPGIDGDLARDGLLAVTARQWRACIEAASRDLPDVDCVLEVRYERFVSEPRAVLADVAEALGWRVADADLDAAARMVRGSGAGGRQRLTEEERAQLDTEIGDLLEELGYERP